MDRFLRHTDHQESRFLSLVQAPHITKHCSINPVSLTLKEHVSVTDFLTIKDNIAEKIRDPFKN